MPGVSKTVAIESTTEWWTKAYSRITTLESCLRSYDLHVTSREEENRRSVIKFLQSQHGLAAGEMRSDAELISRCALKEFAEPDNIKKLSTSTSPVTLQSVASLNLDSTGATNFSTRRWQDTENAIWENSTGYALSRQKLVDGNKGSGWVLVLQISGNKSGPFAYDSDLWTNNETLNPQHTNITSGIDVKLPSYNSQPLTAIRVCVKSFDRCFTIETEANSAQALFSGPFRRRNDLDRNTFERLFADDGMNSSYQADSSCMQRPGFNTVCRGDNKARFGFCGNAPNQPCQSDDNDDSDFAIGLGVSGQANGRSVGSESASISLGAGYTDYFASSNPGAPGSSARGFQTWVFVLAPGSDIQSEIFPPPSPSYLYVTEANCEESFWVQLDLGVDFLVGRVHRWFYFADRAYCNQKIKLSQSGLFAGEEVLVFSCDSYAQCGQETAAGRRIDFEAVQARFIRYYVSRNSLNMQVGHISEIEVYGWPVGEDRNYSKISHASWNEESIVVLNVSKSIHPGESIDVVIPSALGLRLPIDGIRHNQSNFGISSDAALGPVARFPMTPLAVTKAVGSFARSVRIDVNPRRAGTAGTFTIYFAPKMKLVTNDTISFALRGVIGSTSDICIGPAPGFSSKFSRASWNLERFELILTVDAGTYIDINENVSVVVPSSAGLLLPFSGISADTEDFTVSANVEDGSIPYLPFTHHIRTPAVGILNETVISFSSSCAKSNISEIEAATFNMNASCSIACDQSCFEKCVAKSRTEFDYDACSLKCRPGNVDPGNVEAIPGLYLSFRIGMDIQAGELVVLRIPNNTNALDFTCSELPEMSNETASCYCSGGQCPGTTMLVSGNSSYFPSAEWIHPDDLDMFLNSTRKQYGVWGVREHCNSTCTLRCQTSATHSSSSNHIVWPDIFNSSNLTNISLLINSTNISSLSNSTNISSMTNPDDTSRYSIRSCRFNYCVS